MKANLTRETKETTIAVELHLRGQGQYDVETDNRFLTHMMESLTKYAGWNLNLRATGDLEHHLIEDVAIALGQAFHRAYDNAPCARMAYDIIPMDDALVLTAIDLVDRPYYEGPLPIPVWDHWFRSFAMEGRINLHLDVQRGRDTHHIIEAAFKGLGRTMKAALEPREEVVSTKGEVRT